MENKLEQISKEVASQKENKEYFEPAYLLRGDYLNSLKCRCSCNPGPNPGPYCGKARRD